MCSVSSSSASDGFVANDVVDHAFISIETLSFSVGLDILKELPDEGACFCGPSSLGSFESFGLGGATYASNVLTEGNASFVFQYHLQILNCFLQFHPLDCSCNVDSALEV